MSNPDRAPTRYTWRSPLPMPGPSDIVTARGDLTQAAAAKIAGTPRPRWSEYESGKRSIHWAVWELYLLRTSQHPTYTLTPNPWAQGADQS